jgi:hypothetical protein
MGTPLLSTPVLNNPGIGSASERPPTIAVTRRKIPIKKSVRFMVHLLPTAVGFGGTV